MHNSTLEIDLSAVRHNVLALDALCRSAPRPAGVRTYTGVCPAIKADAYGMGAEAVARALCLPAVKMLAAFTVREALGVVDAISRSPRPVLVLMSVDEVSVERPLSAAIASESLHFTVHDPQQLRGLLASTRQACEASGRALPLHVQLDTGMSRGGCAPEDLPEILQTIANAPRHARLAGVFTHFASAPDDEPFTRLQFDRLTDAVRRHASLIPTDCLVHACNTHAALRSSDFHASIIRPGIGLLGYGPELMSEPALLAVGHLRPALRWVSRIVQIKRIAAGETVGYSRRWTARRGSLIGLIPVGYADGYPTQSAPSAGRRVVRVLGGTSTVYAPVVGVVNMDQITVDLTDAATELPSLATGTTVELITPDPTAENHAPRLALASRICVYELATGIGARVTRRYVGLP